MKTNIFIPKRIKVGFQTRSDTYTKQLAYIIYFDEKGVLRKEKSWEGWRDKKIEPQEFDNIPTSGFVLNKKAGGYDTGWNHRQTYCRVYDPRGYEFEITIPNLLYILENTTSTKGKGLEGDFVYGYEGKDLILIPTESPDYKTMEAYNTIVHEKNFIKAKDLIIGATYKAKNNEEWVYMGRFDYYTNKSEKVYYGSGRYDYNWVYTNVNKGKHYFFVMKREDSYFSLLQLKSLGEKFISTVDIDCVENYAELFEKLEGSTDYSPYDSTKDEYITYTFEEFCDRIRNKKDYYNNCNYFNCDKKEYKINYICNSKKGEYEENLFYYKEEGKNYSQRDPSSSSWYPNYIDTTPQGTLEEIFNTIKPMYKNEYLQNNKFYRRVN